MVTTKDEEVRINDQITALKMRVVDADGNMLGVLGREAALKAAEEAGMDLVEVASNADPVVCKILDYGKFRYQQQKKASEARKKQKIITVKEIKLRPNIDTHDYEVKIDKQARKFIGEGDKVKFTIRFRGREMAHQELGLQLLQRIREDLEEIMKIEQEGKLEGRQMIMVGSPR